MDVQTGSPNTDPAALLIPPDADKDTLPSQHG